MFVKKLLIFILVIAATLPVGILSLKKEAQAFPVEEVGPVAGVLIPGIPAIAAESAVTAASTTLTAVGIGDPISGNAAVEAIRKTLGNGCTATLTTADKLETFDNVDSLTGGAGTQTLDVLSGGITEAAKLSAQLVGATAAKECIDAYLLVLGNYPITNLLIGQAIQTEQNKFSTISGSLRDKIEQLKARQSASFKDVLKAFMVKLVLNLNQSLTTKVVNDLVQKHKIDDYLAYGDAVATQVYSMKYINENFEGDARKQAMLRSILQSEKVPEQASLAYNYATSKAEEYLSDQCNNVQINGTTGPTGIDFYNCLAAYGNYNASDEYHFQTAQEEATVVKASAQASAQQEINASDGFAPPRDCSGSVELQQRADAAYKQADAEYTAAKKVTTAMKKALKAGQTTQEEVQKAIDAEAAAQNKLNNDVPKEYNSPVVDICKALDSPGSFVANQLTEYVGQYLEQSANLKSDNLPFYAQFASSVASNFLTNLITGGSSNGKLLKEAGLAALAPAITDVSAAVLTSGDSVNQVNVDTSFTVRFTNAGSGSVPQLISGRNYQAVLDGSGFVRSGGSGLLRVRIRDGQTGADITEFSNIQFNSGNSTLTFSFTAPPRLSSSGTVESRYIAVDIFNTAGESVTRKSLAYELVTGEVRGVVVSQQALPRGPMPVFSPR